ncbi:uncharacterized protein LOC118400938 isoform X2 [Oncorhynchus keta]|uniref:uncharacterized protein LOC118400938 isoform X2 n=1 Tax=Oncorhynchus keta TaxID=8018 RepID=UPI0015F83D43|nr:uncharacterized protein LOC118400938 isoform X2 [Oncorhynchus keta]
MTHCHCYYMMVKFSAQLTETGDTGVHSVPSRVPWLSSMYSTLGTFCSCSQENSEAEDTKFGPIMLTSRFKNLEIFTGSEGGDLATNCTWDTFHRYHCLKNCRRVFKTSAATSSLVCQLCCTWELQMFLAC